MPSLGIAPRPEGCTDQPIDIGTGRGAGFSRLSGGWELASSGDWASSNPAFAISHGSPDITPHTPRHECRFPGMLLSPTAFRLRVSHQTQRYTSYLSLLGREYARAPRGGSPAGAPGQVLVGYQACLAHGGGHTTWTCRLCDETVYGAAHRGTNCTNVEASQNYGICWCSAA